MKRISNLGRIPRKYVDDPDFQTMLKTVMVGASVGCEKLYVNIDFVKPGGKSAKYHSHTKQEEFFLILGGSGILRMDGEETPVGVGDVISKPAGKEIAHQFINNGREVLRILDVGTREKGDVAVYPDENVTYLRDPKWAFDIGGRIPGWITDPNEP